MAEKEIDSETDRLTERLREKQADYSNRERNRKRDMETKKERFLAGFDQPRVPVSVKKNVYIVLVIYHSTA